MSNYNKDQYGNNIINWELVGKSQVAAQITERLAIFGGWLVRVETLLNNEHNFNYVMTFVPDINHEWDINEDFSIKDTKFHYTK